MKLSNCSNNSVEWILEREINLQNLNSVPINSILNTNQFFKNSIGVTVIRF